MKVRQIRQLLGEYSKISDKLGDHEKAAALKSFSQILAPADNKTIYLLVKKLGETHVKNEIIHG